jgi:DNA primase
LTWDEVENGATIEDFRLDNVRQRIAKVGDLWKGLHAQRGRTNLGRFFGS